MYSDKKNILQLAALLKAHGVTHVVLCPGSRNAPIVHTLSNCADFTCYPVTDERSAGFFALGIARRLGKKAAICCTSGSALLNLHPAVAEACYQQLPLVVISADRPAAWIGQMDGQTLPQPSVFGALVKESVSLPEIKTDEDEWYCNRLINEALLHTYIHGCGPVHINIPLSEPLFAFTTPRLPKVRTITHFKINGDNEALASYLKQYSNCSKILIVVGQMESCRVPSELFNGSLSEHCAIFAEHLSNVSACTNSSVITNFDAALYAMTADEKDQIAPDIVISLGGHIVSKRLKQYLRTHRPSAHISVSPDGSMADVFCSLTAAVEGDSNAFLKLLSNVLDSFVSSSYMEQWQTVCNHIPQPRFGYSEMSAVGCLIQRLPAHSALHLANSSVVRYAQFFELPAHVDVCCNRGVNGIEGSLSAAVGYASADSGTLCFVAIGDLSFFYDMNALWNNNYRSNLRLLVLNNGSGEIFHSLPGLAMTDASRQSITAAHTTSARGWAEERGFDYSKVENEKELEQAMTSFVSPQQTERPMLMEVFTDAATDVRLLKDYYHQLKHS